MPKVTVKVPHQGDPKETFGKIRGALEKTVKDFQGVDLQLSRVPATLAEKKATDPRTAG